MGECAIDRVSRRVAFSSGRANQRTHLPQLGYVENHWMEPMILKRQSPGICTQPPEEQTRCATPAIPPLTALFGGPTRPIT